MKRIKLTLAGLTVVLIAGLSVALSQTLLFAQQETSQAGGSQVVVSDKNPKNDENQNQAQGTSTEVKQDSQETKGEAVQDEKKEDTTQEDKDSVTGQSAEPNNEQGSSVKY